MLILIKDFYNLQINIIFVEKVVYYKLYMLVVKVYTNIGSVIKHNVQ